ncbi:hypothetical protein [Klebsiella pneumoniae]|uniref:hypothetical protein n=1 Tax=Klebsiella pneumoniae TaxID=573 RepID=UPI00292CCA90|nr:hypothetical protein [Klebsiella pneumoniae]
MTITLQAVNELIASLESAGELSIREQKFLKLAKAYQQLAAENVVRQEFIKICFRAAADGASLDGSDIQEIGERLGLFGRETYQPMLHGYICGHEAGEDSVYVMKSAPATDRIVAGIKADGVEDMANHFFKLAKDEANSLIAEQWRESGRVANEQAKQLREGADK